MARHSFQTNLSSGRTRPHDDSCVRSWHKPWQAIPQPTEPHCSASAGAFAVQEINALGAIIHPLIKPSARVRATPSARRSAEDVWAGAIAPFDKSEETNDCSRVKSSPSSSLSTLNFTKGRSPPPTVTDHGPDKSGRNSQRWSWNGMSSLVECAFDFL